MKNVLIIGATGQIGSELTMKLRGIYGGGNVVAGYIKGAEPKGELAESGPSALVDITDAAQIADAVKKYDIDTIYNLAALLSAVAEARCEAGAQVPMGFVGTNDVHGECGPYNQLLAKYGMDANAVAAKVREAVSRK